MSRTPTWSCSSTETTYYNKDSDKRNQAECIIAKNRRGETTTIPLQWLPEFTAFSSVERNYEEPY